MVNNAPITHEVVPGIGWVSLSHPQHPDNSSFAAYERHVNREPPIDAGEFDVWLVEARRLLNVAVHNAKMSDSIDELITEARIALARHGRDE